MAVELKKEKYTEDCFIWQLQTYWKDFSAVPALFMGKIDKVNLEMQLFLKCNQSLWNEETVSKIVNEPTQID